MGCSDSKPPNETLQILTTSVKRIDLRKLSRKQLRARLDELGAAKTEADGLFHGELVDVVLLWNSLWQLKCSMHNHDSLAQEGAVRALRNSGLPAHLLRKALLVVGVPWKECCSLNGKEAEALLNARLVQLIMRKAATNMISGTKYTLLLACFQGWKLCRGIPDIAETKAGNLDGDAIFESLREESRRRDEEITLIEQGKCSEASRLAESVPSSRDKDEEMLRNASLEDEEDPRYWQAVEDVNVGKDESPNVTTEIAQPVSPKAKGAVATETVQTKKGRKHRESAKSSKDVVGIKESPKKPVSPRTPRLETDEALMQPAVQKVEQVCKTPATEQVKGTRNDKFEALDSELATWMVDDVEEAAALSPWKLR